MADVHLRSEPGLANAPQPGLVGRGDNDAAHMTQQERETDIKKPPNESEGTDEHMSSGEGAWGLAGTEGPEAATPPEAIVEDPVANADAAAGLGCHWQSSAPWCASPSPRRTRLSNAATP